MALVTKPDSGPELRSQPDARRTKSGPEAQEPTFTLLPAKFPEDYEALLDVATRAFTNEVLSKNLFPSAGTEPSDDHSRPAPAMTPAHHAFRLHRLRYRAEGPKNGVRCHLAKIVVDNNNNHSAGQPSSRPEDTSAAGKRQIVAYALWMAPHVRGVSELTEDEIDSNRTIDGALQLKATGEGPAAARAAANHRSIETRTEAKSDELLGEDRHYCYWYLSELCTLPEWQRRGLGLRLVKWGIRKAEADRREKEERGAVEVVKGCYTIATAEGLRTYLKAGMEAVGSETFEVEERGKREGEEGGHTEGGGAATEVWLVKRF